MSSLLADLRKAIEDQRLESLIASPTVLEKCKLQVSKNQFGCNLFLFQNLGAALFTRYPQNATEFLAKLEAFLMNTHHSSLTLELLGQFEQVLYKDSQNVSLMLQYK
jgi:hypothetical protein